MSHHYISNPLDTVPRDCRQCGKTFFVPYPSYQQKYCSYECYGLGKRRSVVERFWGRVNKNCEYGCWMWMGNPAPEGYGSFAIIKANKTCKGKWARPARFAWILTYGEPPEGMMVLHKCDRFWPFGDFTYRRCVNPDHLFLGTARDNSHDALAKSRLQTGDNHWSKKNPESVKRGSRHYRAKLTEEMVREILQTSSIITRAEAARKFGVTPGLITQVVNRKIWKHVSIQA